MVEYKNVTAIKKEIQKICDNCWHPYRLGGCPEHCGINDAVKAIDSAQTVDAVPVRYGHWIEDPDDWEYQCSECRHLSSCRTVYCSACGARMYGKDGTDGRS